MMQANPERAVSRVCRVVRRPGERLGLKIHSAPESDGSVASRERPSPGIPESQHPNIPTSQHPKIRSQSAV